jgi:hypothetical protein
MALRFTTSRLFLATALASVCCASIAVAYPIIKPRGALQLAGIVSLLSPFWLPAVFIAYCVGRRSFNWKIAFVLATIEAASVAIAVILIWLIGPRDQRLARQQNFGADWRLFGQD